MKKRCMICGVAKLIHFFAPFEWKKNVSNRCRECVRKKHPANGLKIGREVWRRTMTGVMQ